MRPPADARVTVSYPDGAIIIYKNDTRPTVIKLAVLLAVSVSIVSLASIVMAVFIAMVFTALIGMQLMGDSREAIAFSSSTFEYRSGSESVLVRIADVCRVEEISTSYLFLAKPVTVPGVRLVLKSGEEKIFPIDFPARQEILSRLRAMVALA